MQRQILMTGIALLGLSLTLPAQAQDKGKKGEGSEQGKSAQPKGGNKGGGKDAAMRVDKAPNKPVARSAPSDHGSRSVGKSSNAKANANGDGKLAKSLRSQGRSEAKGDERGMKANGANMARGKMARGDNFHFRAVENGRYIWQAPSFQGCPPGLAKKGNGCLPPGQARKLSAYNDQNMLWYRYANWFGGSRGGEWLYDRGYAYRIDPATSLVRSILPLFGGALFGGNNWPQGYTDYQVSPYYERYYGRGDYNGVRYGDGAIFSVNPETQMIGNVVGLLTGDNWSVGSRAPQGYDLYNVPYDYRDRYADNDERSYRYNDGYVYEIDPTTQLVRQIIELVT